MATIQTKNPATEELLAKYTTDSPDQTDQKLDNAMAAFEQHHHVSLQERQQWLRGLADSVENSLEKMAKLATMEMGKPIKQARAELRKCARVCRYYADNAEELMAPRIVDNFAHVYMRPLGPLLAIMPWNFPFWQVFRVLTPALLLGNPVLLKHAENVWGCAHGIEQMVKDAGIPPALCQGLYVSVERLSPVIEDARLAAVTLTGSEQAGRAVAQQAGRAIKPVVLELGGSDPFIVLADADLSAALDAAINGRFQNNGESCIAAKRFIVEAPIYDTFVRRFAARIQTLSCDDPIFESTDVGPLAREDLLIKLEQQVNYTIGYGGRCVVGGHRLATGKGYYFEPTLIADVTETMLPYREELFGPIACVSVAQNADDAIRLANATPFGLGASLWTQAERGHTLAGRIASGCVAVNQITASDPRVPFGGIKNSGIGRELGVDGLRSFANIQTVLL